MPDEQLPAAHAYELIAPCYDEWAWQEFWARNERPEVERWLEGAGGGHLLDVGCGTGTYLELARASGLRVTGLDVSRGMIGAARGKNPQAGLVIADARHLPFAPGTFDRALMTRLLSHIPDVEGVLAEVGRRLRPGGRLLVTDVDADHRYVATRAPTLGGSVLVETFKHRTTDLCRAAELVGLTVEAVERVTSDELAWSPDTGFSSIDRTGVRPIFFVIELRRP